MPPVDRYPLAYHGPCFSVLDQRSVISGPRPCPVWTRGQRTFSYTTPQKRVKYSKSLQRYQSSVQGQKGLCAGELTCFGHTAPCLLGRYGAAREYGLQHSFFIHCIDRHQQWQCFVNYFISLIPISEYWTFATECHCKGWNCGPIVRLPVQASSGVPLRDASVRPG